VNKHPSSDLLATADRLQERRERLADSTARLQLRAKKLEKATERLRKMTQRLSADGGDTDTDAAVAKPRA
jgi:hypothetical protein